MYTKEQIELISSKLIGLKEYQLESDLADQIDETYGYIDIIGHKYPTSMVWRRVDPVAFLQEFRNWLDAMEYVEISTYRDYQHPSTMYYRQDDIDDLLNKQGE